MYSTASYITFVIATTLGFIFIHMTRALPMTDGIGRISTLASDDTNGTNRPEGTLIYNDTTGRLQFDHIITDHKLEASELSHRPVVHKCKRNKRHVHRQINDNHVDIADPTDSLSSDAKTTRPLTDADILDIELQYQIEKVKRKILEKLHLHQPPAVPAARPQIPQELSRKLVPEDTQIQTLLRNESSAQDDSDTDVDVDVAEDAAKTTQVIVIAKNGTGECDFNDSSFCFKFKAPTATISNSEITSSSMWVYILPDPSNNSSTAYRGILTITRPANHYGHRVTLASRRIDVSEGWVEISMKHGLHKWGNKQEQFVEIDFDQNSTRLSTLSSQQPKLVLDVKSRPRVSRSTTRRRVCQATTAQCCMQRYTINFADIGWDFIISPVQYVANYCRGTCTSVGPFTYDHSQVASLQAHQLRSLNRGTDSVNAAIEADLTPCCAPEQLEPLIIMYLNDDNEIVVDTLPNMVVTSCGCA